MYIDLSFRAMKDLVILSSLMLMGGLQIVCVALEMPGIKNNVLMHSICVLFFAGIQQELFLDIKHSYW